MTHNKPQRSICTSSDTATLRFSRHASERLKQRNIELTENIYADVAMTVDSLAQKGCQSALVMVGQTALVISVAKRIIITAFGQETLKEQIVTNIDSVAFVSA